MTRIKWEKYWTKKRVKITINKKRIMNILESYVHGRILDAGCGSGFFSKFFLEKGCEVFALDYSKQALLMTRRLDQKINLIEASVFNTPFKNETFDFIFSDGLLEHYKNPEKILLEFKRIVKTGGIILTFVPNKYSYWIFFKPLKLRGIKEYRFNLNEIISLHKNLGLRIVDSGGFSVFPSKISPEFLGKHFGRILYVIAKK
jgi:SAM-dependent methyltransferase